MPPQTSSGIPGRERPKSEDLAIGARAIPELLAIRGVREALRHAPRGTDGDELPYTRVARTDAQDGRNPAGVAHQVDPVRGHEFETFEIRGGGRDIGSRVGALR